MIGFSNNTPAVEMRNQLEQELVRLDLKRGNIGTIDTI